MGAITGTLAKLTEFSGDQKLLIITATTAAASDTITLTAATHGISTITGIVGATYTTGLASTLLSVQVSFSGLVLTVVSKDAAGGVATTFGNVSIAIMGT